MNDKSIEKVLIKKHLSALNLIIKREILCSGPNNSSKDYSEMGWDLENLRFNLTISEFTNLLSSLEKEDVLKILSGIVVPEYVGENHVLAYDESGEIIDSNQIVITYDKVNLKNAESRLEKLEKYLTQNEIIKIKKDSGLSTEKKLFEAGPLNLRYSGLICYDNKIIEMRVGLKTLCEIFIKRPNQLINRDDILDELGIRSKKQKDTVAKYTSALNIILREYFNKDTIVNDKKHGWRFSP